MVQIRRVTLHRRSVPLLRPFVTAVRRTDTVDALIVEVVDSDGRSGWGEAPTSWRVTGESHASVTAVVEGPLSEAVLRTPADDPHNVSAQLAQAVVGNSSARMAVECAIWDLAARGAERPLYEYLGGTRNVIESDMTLSAAVTAADAADLIRTAREHVGRGYTTLKIKTGAGGNDLETVKHVRDVLGEWITLRVDANQGWTPGEAVSIINDWRDAGVNVELVEQPVHRDDIAGLAYVTEHTTTPIVADETVWTRRQLREVLQARAVSRINIKLAKTGGLAEALALGELAAQNAVDVFVGCMSESHVGIASAAALASALTSTNGLRGAQDLDAGLWLAASPVTGGVFYEGASITLPRSPGTGIAGLASESET